MKTAPWHRAFNASAPCVLLWGLSLTSSGCGGPRINDLALHSATLEFRAFQHASGLSAEVTLHGGEGCERFRDDLTVTVNGVPLFLTRKEPEDCGGTVGPSRSSSVTFAGSLEGTVGEDVTVVAADSERSKRATISDVVRARTVSLEGEPPMPLASGQRIRLVFEDARVRTRLRGTLVQEGSETDPMATAWARFAADEPVPSQDPRQPSVSQEVVVADARGYAGRATLLADYVEEATVRECGFASCAADTQVLGLASEPYTLEAAACHNNAAPTVTATTVPDATYTALSGGTLVAGLYVLQEIRLVGITQGDGTTAGSLDLMPQPDGTALAHVTRVDGSGNTTRTTLRIETQFATWRETQECPPLPHVLTRDLAFGLAENRLSLWQPVAPQSQRGLLTIYAATP